MGSFQIRRLILILTNCCNATCPHCLRAKNGQSIEMTVLKKVVLEAKDFGCKLFSLTGGEACLHPNFTEIVQFITSQNLDFTVISNAKKYEEYIPLLKLKPRLRWINFTLDGLQTNHDKSRGEGSFDKVIQATLFFANQIPVNLNICLSRRNVDELDQIIRMGDSIGAKSLKILSIIANKKNDPLILTQKERRTAIQKITMSPYKDKLRIVKASSICENKRVNFCAEMQDERRVLAVNPSGQVNFCCDIMGNGFILGDLKRESLKKIINRSMEFSCFLQEKRMEYLTQNHPIIQETLCHFCNFVAGKFKL